MTTLNPASQPFVPANPFVRLDSGSRLRGDGSYPVAAGDVSASRTPTDKSRSSDCDDWPSVQEGGAQTPGRASAENSLGVETVVAGPIDHSRLSSALSSSSTSFRSALSSPPTPPDGELLVERPTDATVVGTGGLKIQMPATYPHDDSNAVHILSESPRGSITSLPRSASQDTESVESRSLPKTDLDDAISPMFARGLGEDAAFRAPDAHSRRDRPKTGQSDALSTSPANVGPESFGSVSSGFLSNIGGDAASNSNQRPGLQLHSSPFNRMGSRFSSYGNVGNNQARGQTPINDLAAPSAGQPQQLYQTTVQSPPPSVSRSMSLSLLNPNGIQSPSGPMRKSSFAFDQNYSPQQQPSRSPLPSTFQNYNLGNSGVISQHASATNTPTDTAFRQLAAGLSSGVLNSLSTHVGGDNMSSSPSSSVRSSAGHIYEAAANFDAQAKASPFLNDILDRVIRCEYSTREVQKELNSLNAKVSLLLDRLGPSGGSGSSRIQPADTHRGDVSTAPFPGLSTTPTGGPHGGNTNVAANFYSFPNASSTSSLLSPAPNGSRDRDEEIHQISQRLSFLVTSVSQLQSQIHFNAGLAAPSPGVLGSGTAMASPRGMTGGSSTGLGMVIGTPGLPGTPDIQQGGMVGGRQDSGISRPSPRAPIPVRTWSSSSIDMLVTAGGGRPDGSMGPPMPKDKRRSMISGPRRDSAGLDGNVDWAAGSPKDTGSGPVISKWEQLPLMPELLRSIAKYGVGPPNKIQQRALPFLLRGADIIAQAPPTQERIAAYAIPAIHVVLSSPGGAASNNRGPTVLIVSTTVDQATQAQRMIRDMGTPIGVRSALGIGSGGDLQEVRQMQQNMPHILCGTPQKLHSLLTIPGGISGEEVRFLVLDEVDQLIARNLHEFVFGIVKLLPPARSKPLSQLNQQSSSGSVTPLASPAIGNPSSFSPFDPTSTSSASGFAGPVRRFSTAVGSSPHPEQIGQIDRQTALFSNTVPQDVLNLANAIQLREPVRVLVRRDGNVTQSDPSSSSRGLRQYYLYLAFTASGAASRPESKSSQAPVSGLGIIGSGRTGGSNLTSSETNQARVWKLDALADLFDDLDVSQVIVHVGGMASLDAVVYKLASHGLEAIPLHGDMSTATRGASLAKFRTPVAGGGRGATTRALVVYDVQVKSSDVHQIPLIINYDLPKAVEEYAYRVAPAISNNYSRSGVVVNFVTATGGDVEMLRSIECFYKIKCPEVPMSLRDVL